MNKETATGFGYGYEYDKIGNIKGITDSGNIAIKNAIRYTGYCFDAGMGFCSLQSRYYDPEIGRFIYADGQLNDDILGNNLFAYCGNNPVKRSDPDGQVFMFLTIQLYKKPSRFALLLQRSDSAF